MSSKSSLMVGRGCVFQSEVVLADTPYRPSFTRRGDKYLYNRRIRLSSRSSFAVVALPQGSGSPLLPPSRCLVLLVYAVCG